MDKKVSIVVPVYRAQEFIQNTMDCVLAQTYSDWELFLVVDDPQDETIAVIRNYIDEKKENRIHILIQEENQGAALARNRVCRKQPGVILRIWMQTICGGLKSWRRCLPFWKKNKRLLDSPAMSLRIKTELAWER